jgi:hypothetical protein
MPLHLIKLCVGAASVDDLAAWQTARLAQLRRKDAAARISHATFQTPKRAEELLDGGSLYWVVKGVIQVRQRIVGLADGTRDDGKPCCLIELDEALVAVSPTPRRAFQGWRYLSADDAPGDLGKGAGRGIEAMPERLRRQLAELGLI